MCIVILKAVIDKAFTIFAFSHGCVGTVVANYADCLARDLRIEASFLERRPELAAYRIGFLGQKMFNPVYASQKLHKMRRSLMLRKTLLLAIVAGAALLVAGPSPASASLFSYEGCGGGCGGGCGYSSCGC